MTYGSSYDDVGRIRAAVQIVGGVALTVAGVLLTALGSLSPRRVDILLVGAAMTALGGFVASWVPANIVARKDAERAASATEEAMSIRLDAVQRAVAQAASEISRTVLQAQQGHISHEVAFPLVSQATTTIVGQVNEIGVICGTSLDQTGMLETHDVVRQVAESLDAFSKAPATADPSALMEAASMLRTTLATPSPAPRESVRRVSVHCPWCGTRAQLSLRERKGETRATTCASCGRPFNVHQGAGTHVFTRPRVGEVAPPVASDESVRCPSCGATSSVRLGAHSGSTSEATCSRCSCVFNVHRAADGSTFTRATPPVVRVGCVACGAVLSVRESGGTRDLACFGCGARLHRDATTSVVSVVGRFERRASAVLPSTAKRPTVVCAGCQALLPARVNTGTDFGAVCFDCGLIYAVPQEEWAAVRDAEARRPRNYTSNL